MPYQYDVFLSHNSKDKPAVEIIAKALQQKYGIKCWLDKWNLVPGEPWQEALEEALNQSRTVAVFVGPNTISPWENEEMRSALEERVHNKARRVIPILLPGSPDVQKLKLPRFLKRLTWVDLRAGLNDEETLYRLGCGIKGIAPGTLTDLSTLSSFLTSEKLVAVQLILEGEFSEFNEIKRDDLVGVLAALLHVDKSSVKILRTYQGSIIVELELTEVGAIRLLKYFEGGDFRLKKLGIISVKLLKSQDTDPQVSATIPKAKKAKNTKRPVTITAAWISLVGALVIGIATVAAPYIVNSWNASSRQVEYVGRVIDQNSQEPISGAQISLDLEGVPPIVYTDSVGVYRFDVLLKSNISGQIRVDAEGYQVYTRNIMLSPNSTTIEDIRLVSRSFATPTETQPPTPTSGPTPEETQQGFIAITEVQPSSGEWVHADSSQCLWTNATGQGAYINLTLAGESTVSKLRISLFDPFVRRIRLTFSDNSQQTKDLDEIADYAYQDVPLEPARTSSIRVEVLEVQDNAFGNFGICHIEVFGTEPTPIPSPDGADPLADGPDHIDAFGVPMRLVPAGSFVMGSDADTAVAECEQFGIDCELEWFINEEPVHEVYLDDYYIDKYEVTNKFYEACVDAEVCNPPIQSRSFARDDYFGNSEFDDFPVVYVNWDMAETYCEWRGAKLPTEAQWEKAARGPDERIFPWGNDIDYKYANFDQIIRDTTMVSQYEKGKSPYGVYDLAGNTVEWVYDWYSETYYQISPSSNPMGPEPHQGDGRVVRGGSWFDKDQIRSAWREGWEPFTNRDGLGFRCAANANP